METEIIYNFAVLVAVVMGLTQVIKLTIGASFDRFAPLTAIVLGVAISVLMSGQTSAAVLQGIVGALSAMGLYSGGKATIKG